MKTVKIISKQPVWEENGLYFNHCHCSTLVVNEKGDILVSYFGGDREGAPNLAIWLSRRINGHWEEPRRLQEVYGLCHYNPLLHNQDGRVTLFYKRGIDVPRWYTMVCHSYDFGRTWSQAEELIYGDHTPRCSSKNKIVVGSDGTWMGPCSIEKEIEWDCYIDISRDHGRTWEKHPIPFSHIVQEQTGTVEWDGLNDLWESNPSVVMKWDGVIQPTLWERSPGKWSCLMRSTRGCIYRSDSEDGGETWSEAYPTELANNNSGIDLVKLDDGTLVLVHNPVSGNWSYRTPLSVSISEDDGMTWIEAIRLETDQGEFSYPAIICADGRIHITYTSRRKQIIYCEISVTDDGCGGTDHV